MRVFAYMDPESGLELHTEQFRGFYTEIEVPEAVMRRYNAARTELSSVEDEILAVVRAAETSQGKEKG